MIKTSARCFLCSLFFCAHTMMAQQPAIKNIGVNQQRIEKRIAELAKFGKDSLGRGYRVAYTKGDQEGRAWYIDLLQKAGLEVHIDEAGNIIAKRKGKNASLKPIALVLISIWCPMAVIMTVALVLSVRWS